MFRWHLKLSQRHRMYIINALLFQLGWLLCVLGGDAIAIVSLVILLVLHQWLLRVTLNEWMLISSLALLGAVVDSLLINLSLLPLDAWKIAGVSVAPLWLICLWTMFATTLCHSLSPLCHSAALAAVVAVIGAPWSYWGGAYLLDIKLPLQGIVAIAVVWLLWFPLVMHNVVRKLVINAPSQLPLYAR